MTWLTLCISQNSPTNQKRIKSNATVLNLSSFVLIILTLQCILIHNCDSATVPSFESAFTTEEQQRLDDSEIQSSFVSGFTLLTQGFQSHRENNEESVDKSKVHKNCSEPSIKDFPSDLFSESDLRHGAIVCHILLSCYVFYSIAYLCEAFFVPSIELICKALNIPSDIAACTFMAIGTSSPEFFTNLLGTFLTKGDIGVGSVVGSVVFNLLAIVSWCGLAVSKPLKLDVWPLTRDCGFYVLSVLSLIAILWDGKIYWYEALSLVLAYCVYLIIISCNKKIETLLESWFSGQSDTIAVKTKVVRSPTRERLRELIVCSLSYDGFKSSNESTPLLSDKSGRYILIPKLIPTIGEVNSNSVTSTVPSSPSDRKRQTYEELNTKEHKEEFGLFEPPRGKSFMTWLGWIWTWPARFILHLTIPDCRMLCYKDWYPLTFFMCIIYMAVFSYLITWMMTVIGHILWIPDSILGIGPIAAGTSLPEAISSIIVAKQGLGTMSISNSVGSNTFNILLCLGLPWLIRTGFLASSSGHGYISMSNSGFGYVSVFLLVSAVILYILIACNKYYLDFKIGVISISMYLIFLVFASLLELNVFFPVNLPMCGST